VYVHYLDDGRVTFAWDHWGVPSVESAPVQIEHGHPYQLHIVMARSFNLISVSLNETEILRVATEIYPSLPDQVTIGENHIGGTLPSSRFSGTTTVVSIR
jgi:hypothetical protein